jgi:hypothetical protein
MPTIDSHVDYCEMMSIGRYFELSDIATDQSGLITNAQARQAKISPRRVARLVKRGALRRLEHGMHQLAGTPHDPLANITRVRLASDHEPPAAAHLGQANPDWVMSQRVAANVHRLDKFSAENQRRTRHRDARRLTRDLWQILDALPATTAARTIADLAHSRLDGGHLGGVVRTVDAMLSSSTASCRPAVAWRSVAVVAAAAAAVHLAVATRYGWHRDEFYFVICGRHPAWGYVDQPPLTPLLARVAAASSDGVLPLRLLAIAAQVGCIALAAPLAAEFGGRRLAQVIAAAAVAACPAFVAASRSFGTSVIDQLIWLAVLTLVARALRIRTVAAWLLAGAVAGIGLENKHTVIVLLAGTALGLVMFRREVLRTAGPWLAGGLALLFASPNLVWNAAHRWPNLQMAQVLSRRQGGPLGSLTHLPMFGVVSAGPLLVPLWVLGVRLLISPAGREHRWALAIVGMVLAIFTISGGKPYYSAPVLAILFAAGAVRVEAAATARTRLGWAVAIGASFVAAALVSLPVLPVAAANTLRRAHPELLETYGWPQFADQVAAAASSLPADVPIFAGNYGEAGALTLLGPATNLHRPVYSGHNNYSLWGPPIGRPNTVLCVGYFDIEYLRQFWSQVEVLAPIAMPGGIQNSEIIRHATIYLCQQPHGSWAELWPRLRHFD